MPLPHLRDAWTLSNSHDRQSDLCPQDTRRFGRKRHPRGPLRSATLVMVRSHPNQFHRLEDLGASGYQLLRIQGLLMLSRLQSNFNSSRSLRGSARRSRWLMRQQKLPTRPQKPRGHELWRSRSRLSSALRSWSDKSKSSSRRHSVRGVQL